MLAVTIKGLLAHLRRLASTFLAVLLGIAFLSGTLVLGDTIKQSFNRLLATVNSTTDAYVRRTDASGGGGGGVGIGGGRGQGHLDASLIATVRGTGGVAAAEGVVQSRGVQLLDRSGNLVGG